MKLPTAAKTSYPSAVVFGVHLTARAEYLGIDIRQRMKSNTS